jgi:hypothetical protein
MNPLEIISSIVFPLSLGSLQLAIGQERTQLSGRVGMFRSKAFLNIVFFLSFFPMVASGIVLFLYSWILLLCLFFGTAIAFPLFGKSLLMMLWSIPFRILDTWARRRL